MIAFHVVRFAASDTAMQMTLTTRKSKFEVTENTSSSKGNPSNPKRKIHYESSLSKEQLSRILVDRGRAMKTDNSELNKILPSNKKVVLKPSEPLMLKLVYDKEDDSVELHMQIEWTPWENRDEKAN